MKKLILSGDDVSKFWAQRTSSVAPSLSATSRFLKDSQAVTNFNHQTAIDEGFRNAKRDTIADNGRPVTVLEARMGKMLKRDQIEKMLKSLNPNLLFEVSKADTSKIGCYIVDKKSKEGRRFLCGFENGWSPEFTVVHTKKERRMVQPINSAPIWEDVEEYVGEKRGWRKLIASLIKSKVINKTRAEKVFGLPTHDSQRWTEHINAD